MHLKAGEEEKNTELPTCFGCLEQVFPMMENGLRQTPDECFYHCPVKTRCLRVAVSGVAGAQVEEEIIERKSRSGMMNFFERWSRKKQIHRRLSGSEKNRKNR